MASVVSVESKVQENKAISEEQLALRLECSASGKTVLSHRYMAYPLSVSPVFRLEESAQNRAYLYRMNTSPGLLAGDALKLSFTLDAGSQLYLADQAATKVHAMPEVDSQATVDYSIEVGDRATLEFLPEPLILFADAALKQTTEITLSDTATLCWGEIILPGRLARGEAYEFRECFSRVRVKAPGGRLWFTDAMKLTGKENRFAQQALFASGKVIGTLLLILPEETATKQVLAELSKAVDSLSSESLTLASSVLPQERGLFVRAVGQTTREMQATFKLAVNAVRTVRGEALLPYSV
ncbi:MAG: urease accessory protein UreD [Phormidesmis sp.]